jgi:hypothetical protein
LGVLVAADLNLSQKYFMAVVIGVGRVHKRARWFQNDLRIYYPEPD